MSRTRHYSRAPITEAIIDLRVAPRAEVTLEELARVAAGEEAVYPKKEKTFEAMGRMEVGAGQSASASANYRETGFKFTSEDGRLIFQSRIEGFTLSRLAPCERWEPFRDEARRLWKRYREHAGPDRIVRLAVRYINRIDVPADGIDLKQYFRTFPEVSPDLPQQLTGFFMQLRIPQADLPGEALINQTIIPPAREGVSSIVLDVDLFRDKDAPGEEDAIWTFFETLHSRKNDIFEACITDRTRELIQ